MYGLFVVKKKMKKRKAMLRNKDSNVSTRAQSATSLLCKEPLDDVYPYPLPKLTSLFMLLLTFQRPISLDILPLRLRAGTEKEPVYVAS